jgi:hypothetical protein
MPVGPRATNPGTADSTPHPSRSRLRICCRRAGATCMASLAMLLVVVQRRTAADIRAKTEGNPDMAINIAEKTGPRLGSRRLASGKLLGYRVPLTGFAQPAWGFPQFSTGFP